MMQVVLATRPSPLLRALRRSAATAGVALTALGEHERPWATATFTGALQRIEFVPDAAPAFAAWLATLPDADLDTRGCIVVDLAIEAPATIVALVMRTDE